MKRSSLPHQIVLLVCAVLIAVLAVLWISLYSVREAMNQDAAEESKRRMQGRLVTLQDEVSLIASDYHNWTDVYLNAWDLDLARLASNYGITAERGDVFQYAEMFDGPFENAISWRAGMGLMPQPGFLDPVTKDVLRQQVRSLDIAQRQTHNYFEYKNGKIIAFSSSYLLPESDELMEGLDPQEQSIAVIGRILSAERLDKIAREFEMQNLSVSDPKV